MENPEETEERAKQIIVALTEKLAEMNTEMKPETNPVEGAHTVDLEPPMLIGRNRQQVKEKFPTMTISIGDPGKLRAGALVGVLWKENGELKYHPSMFSIKGIWRNGRLNLKERRRK
jgi:hypothetical protein